MSETYLLCTVGEGYRLLKQCGDLPRGHCGAGVHAVLAVLVNSSRALRGRGEGCLSSVGTYLPRTVGQGFRLFKLYRNIPRKHCWAGLQAVLAVSEFTSHAQWGRGSGCLSMLEPTSQALWGRVAGCLSGV